MTKTEKIPELHFPLIQFLIMSAILIQSMVILSERLKTPQEKKKNW